MIRIIILSLDRAFVTGIAFQRATFVKYYKKAKAVASDDTTAFDKFLVRVFLQHLFKKASNIKGLQAV